MASGFENSQEWYFCLTDVAWAGDEAAKRQQARFQFTESEFEQVPSRVVSLMDALERCSAVLASFRRENVTFKFADASQASSGLPTDDVANNMDILNLPIQYVTTAPYWYASVRPCVCDPCCI